MIESVTRGYRLLDTWRLDVRVGDGEFGEFFRIAKENGFKTDGRIADALFRLRWWLGRVFGWDREEPRVAFSYDNEAALALANATIEGVLHFAHVDGGVVMTIYIKPRGWYSNLYMALIKPFRYWVVYPVWLGRLARLWRERATGVAPNPPRT